MSRAPRTQQEFLFQAKLQARGYEVREQIGKGGYATCYRVWSLQYKQTFVCKIMHIPQSFGTPQKRQEIINSYQQELKALTSLFHPNIVSIYNHFVEDNDLFLILEDCNKGSLDSVLKRFHQIDPLKIIIYLKQIVSALVCCHSHKIAHRDIKPGNLLIHDDVVKLADFGLALEVTSNVEYLVGSLPFMAPEMFGKQPYDPLKSDIWALGVTIYLLSMGSYPFETSNLTEFVEKITNVKLDLPNSLHPAIHRLIHHTIVSDPSKRWDIQQISLFLEQIPTPQLNYKKISSRQSRSATVLPDAPSQPLIFQIQRQNQRKVNFRNHNNISLPPLSLL